MILLAVFLVLILLYAVLSARLERTVVTAPIVFTAAGMLALRCLPDQGFGSSGGELLLQLAELGLVLLLFTDASRTELRLLRSFRDLPVRLLTTGLLLSILLGGLAALAVFPQLSLWEAGILAAILAPTDAGLGQVIVSSPRVPLKIRQALNVEAGLNDGLAVPFLLFFIALAGSGESDGPIRLGPFILQQLGLGTLLGVGIGLCGGALLGWSRRRGWMAASWLRLGAAALPLLCVLASDALGASMFIAAFVAGLSAQVGFREVGAHSVELAEDWGQLLNLSIFFLFGLLIARGPFELDVALVLYAVLSLTIVRMLPVALALKGTRLSRASVLFMGWFGPRGLASIVLGMVYIEQVSHVAGEPTIVLAVQCTVLLSIFAHGLSAMPGIDLYARAVAALPQGAPELEGQAAQDGSDTSGDLAHQQPR